MKATLALLLSIAVAAPALAETVSPSSGHAFPRTAEERFQLESNLGHVQNVSNEVSSWCVYPAVTSGPRAIHVLASVPRGDAIQCFSQAVTSRASNAPPGDASFATASGSSADAVMHVTVPDQGALSICCDMTPGTVLQTIRY